MPKICNAVERRTDFIVAERLGAGDVVSGNGEAGEGEGEAQAGAGGAAQGGAAVDVVEVELHLSAPRLPNVGVPPCAAAAPPRRRQPPARQPRQVPAAAVRRRVDGRGRRLHCPQRRRDRLHQLVGLGSYETSRLLHFFFNFCHELKQINICT